MLKEVHNVKQDGSDSHRRWFTDQYFDLIVWYGPDEKIAGFQLCYDKATDEHAVTWRQGEGFSHHRIDDGELSGRSKMTPILVQDGVFDKKTITDRFLDASVSIESGIREFVRDKLQQY